MSGGDVTAGAYTGDGPHVSSGFMDGLQIDAAKTAVIAWLEEHDAGSGTVQYRLRDWLFSRQRYWGEPFPVVHTEDGVELVDDDKLEQGAPEGPGDLKRSYGDEESAEEGTVMVFT